MMYLHLHEAPPSIHAQVPSVSLAVEAVVVKALAKRPEDRYQSAGDLATAFRNALLNKKAPLIESLRGSSSSQQPVATSASGSGLLLIGLVILVLIAAGLGVYSVLHLLSTPPIIPPTSVAADSGTSTAALASPSALVVAAAPSSTATATASPTNTQAPSATKH